MGLGSSKAPAHTKEECHIWITYCGGWGYSSFARVKSAIEAAVPHIIVDGEATKGVSGAFEVQGVPNNKMYHTKLGGGGYVHSDQAKMDAMIASIKADLGAVAEKQASANKK